MTASKRDQLKRRKEVARMTDRDLNNLAVYYQSFPWAFKRDEIAQVKAEQRWRATFRKMTDKTYVPEEDYRDREM